MKKPNYNEAVQILFEKFDELEATAAKYETGEIHAPGKDAINILSMIPPMIRIIEITAKHSPGIPDSARSDIIRFSSGIGELVEIAKSDIPKISPADKAAEIRNSLRLSREAHFADENIFGIMEAQVSNALRLAGPNAKATVIRLLDKMPFKDARIFVGLICSIDEHSGKALSKRGIAKKEGIQWNTYLAREKKFRERYPEEWRLVESIRKGAKDVARGLHDPLSMDAEFGKGENVSKGKNVGASLHDSESDKKALTVNQLEAEAEDAYGDDAAAAIDLIEKAFELGRRTARKDR